ncbi:succinate dehydrogenase assembly factor 2 [Salinisphaera sp. Q1T1-3]|uniref:FAD assembly factor SdhE n=1 Tax=Salinisphaera sp. Q1T1-3 TaxID=2321229 RepID=UPI00131489B8|nr:succinate dehydrogenase assembly factor 2 [Salinisphaera sp. Q1T1-3]
MSELRRVRWLCRRGMKELDVLLDRFVTAEYDGLSEQEHAALISLLRREDPDLWYLVMGRMPADDPVEESLLGRIRQFESTQR